MFKDSLFAGSQFLVVLAGLNETHAVGGEIMLPSGTVIFPEAHRADFVAGDFVQREVLAARAHELPILALVILRVVALAELGEGVVIAFDRVTHTG
jgi:hypothetical protein